MKRTIATFLAAAAIAVAGFSTSAAVSASTEHTGQDTSVATGWWPNFAKSSVEATGWWPNFTKSSSVEATGWWPNSTKNKNNDF